jgi:hypothetical protein
MTQLVTSLHEQVEAIQAALGSVTHPSEQMKSIFDRARKLEAKIQAWRDQPKLAVEAYNQARRQLVIEAAKAKGLGWCSSGEHLVPAERLEGLIKAGAYVTSGYYEHLRDFSSRGTVCSDCRHKLRGGPGRYDGEFTNYHTFELKDPLSSLEELGNYWYLERLAKQSLGFDLPAFATYDRLKGVTIGKTTITSG